MFLSYCSVMWSYNLNDDLSFRFIFSGGTLMTIFSELQKVSAGAGGCGFAQNH